VTLSIPLTDAEADRLAKYLRSVLRTRLFQRPGTAPLELLRSVMRKVVAELEAEGFVERQPLRRVK
jgi:hypothetical protein